MPLDDLRSAIQKRLSNAPPLGYRVELTLGDDDHFYLDGTNGPTQIVDSVSDSVDTTMTLSAETMQKILDGSTDPNMAVLMGKLKISGKMGVALKLASFLEQ